MSWVIAVVNIGNGLVNKGYRLVCLDFVSLKVLSVVRKSMRAMCFAVDHGSSVFPARVRPRPCARSLFLCQSCAITACTPPHDHFWMLTTMELSFIRMLRSAFRKMRNWRTLKSSYLPCHS